MLFIMDYRLTLKLKLSVARTYYNFINQLILYWYSYRPESTVKPVLSGHSKEDQKLVFKTNYRLINAGQKYCRMLQESILQYFRT